MSPRPQHIGTWAAAHSPDLAAISTDTSGLLRQVASVGGAVAIGHTVNAELVAIGSERDAAHKSLRPWYRVALLTWGYHHAQ